MTSSTEFGERAGSRRAAYALSIAVALTYVVEFALSPAAQTRAPAESLERSASAALIWFALGYCALLAWEIVWRVVGRALAASPRRTRARR